MVENNLSDLNFCCVGRGGAAKFQVWGLLLEGGVVSARCGVQELLFLHGGGYVTRCRIPGVIAWRLSPLQHCTWRSPPSYAVSLHVRHDPGGLVDYYSDAAFLCHRAVVW